MLIHMARKQPSQKEKSFGGSGGRLAQSIKQREAARQRTLAARARQRTLEGSADQSVDAIATLATEHALDPQQQTAPAQTSSRPKRKCTEKARLLGGTDVPGWTTADPAVRKGWYLYKRFSTLGLPRLAWFNNVHWPDGQGGDSFISAVHPSGLPFLLPVTSTLRWTTKGGRRQGQATSEAAS